MRNRILGLWFFFLLGLSISPIVIATEPADKIIANAQTDLERYESQASALTPGRAANARRMLKLMNLSYERLESSGNRDDPSWIEVNDRYLSLQKQLENLINPAASTATTSSTARTGGSLQASQASPASTGSPAVLPSASTTAPSQQSVPDLVSGQRVQVKKLARDLSNSRKSIAVTGPSQFQDPDVIAARQKRLQQYTDAIARYPQLDDPDVQAARAEYSALRDALSTEFERAKGQLSQLGDVQSSLRQLDENSRTYPVPQSLQSPFSAEEASVWVKAASSARTVAEHNSKQLEIIAPLAYLPNNPGTPEGGSPYDANDVIRLKNNALSSLDKIQANYEAMANGLGNYMESMNNDVFQRWQEDSAKSDTRYLFIGEGRPEEAKQVFNENRAMVNSAIYLEQALGRDSSEAEAVLAKLDQAEADFDRKAQIALASSKLPEPASDNKQMLKIAEQILSKPSYEFGQHGKIILTTSEVVERERKDSEIDIDDADLSTSGDLTFSGTQTTWTYAWKEFKFATPLKETDSDTWYIWWITAKNFSSGGSRTPLNQWISGEATKGNPILPENM